MHYNKAVIAFGLFLILLGCGLNSTNESTGNEDKPIELTKLTTHSTIDQHPANQAKESLRKHKEITSIKAVNSNKKLAIAVEVEHNERLKLAKIKKKLTKEMKKRFSKMDVEFSTDKKIFIELESLEEKIKSDSITKKTLKREINRIINLAKEKT